LQDKNNVWIGLKDKTWMTGESFVNVFDISTQLNNYDITFTYDPEEHCGVMKLASTTPLQDESCNIRKKHFFCV
jgi:hypothetical protein